jgi:type VI secretion system secreted protein VgrG
MSQIPTVERFFFAWDGAPAPAWATLRVLSARGHEALGQLYRYTLELVAPHDSQLALDDLVGKKATLRIATETSPSARYVHGVIESAEDLGDVDAGARGVQFRVVLAPPLVAATMQKKSLIFLDKPLRHMLETTLSRLSLGAGLTKDLVALPLADDDFDPHGEYVPFEAGFRLEVDDPAVLDDATLHPYCVQYGEDDVSFVLRLCEHNGLGVHFEHDQGTCTMVITDHDELRPHLEGPLAPQVKGRELDRPRLGARLRPQSVTLSDYHYEKPDLDLRSHSKSTGELGPIHAFEAPGDHTTPERGEKLAKVRASALGSEATWLEADLRCRAPFAGSVFEVDHPEDRFRGSYLVVELEVRIENQSSFGRPDPAEIPYLAKVRALRSGPGGSGYRPQRRTTRPRIHGSQTAVVTALPGETPEPGAQALHTGGPCDLGSVRVRFHWDRDLDRHEKEPTSCWVRVSQLFAGNDHGALWNPRVGEEVIVEYLEGDPDRPIIVGRVYNGTHRPSQNATARPTWSAIKSFTVPADGTYNMLAFEDQQGQQEIILHACRDHNVTVDRNESVTVAGSHSTSAGSISESSGSTFSMSAKADMTATTEANFSEKSSGQTSLDAGTTLKTRSGGLTEMTAGSNLVAGAAAAMHLSATTISLGALGTITLSAAGSILEQALNITIVAGSKVAIKASNVSVVATGKAQVQGSDVSVAGHTIAVMATGKTTVSGASVDVTAAGTAAVTAATVNVGGGSVNVNGGSVSIKGDVKINC